MLSARWKYCLFVTLLVVESQALAASSSGAIRYDIIGGGRTLGIQTSTWSKGRTIRVEMTFRDNGRGTDLVERLSLAEDGTPTTYRSTGKTRLGAPIDERFDRAPAGGASWSSTSEKGVTLERRGFYVPVEGSFEIGALIASALLRVPSRHMKAFPAGALTLRPVLKTTLAQADRRVRVGLYLISGSMLEPWPVWIREDGDRRLFADLSNERMHVIDAAWRGNLEQLRSLQASAQEQRALAQSRTLAHHPAEPILIRGVRVFDAERARLTDAQDVYIQEGRIAAVLPSGAAPRASAATVIDGAGRVLVPGLFEMHAHEGEVGAMLEIAAGITTSRDLANDNALLARLRSRIGRGEAVGPRIIPLGFIEGRSEHSANGGIVVASLAEALAAVDQYAARGYRQLKLYSSFKPEWVAETVARAHKLGMRVGGHVPAFMTAEEAVRAGYDEVHHVSQLVLNFLVKPGDDTRTPIRFQRVAEGAGTLDLESPRVRQFVELIRERGVVVDPTLATLEGLLTQRDGEVNPAYASVFDHLPLDVQRVLRRNEMRPRPESEAAYRASWTTLLALVGLLHRSGVQLVAGSDSLPGFTLHRELELYVRAGIPAAEVLRIATFVAATRADASNETGAIHPGLRADLVLIEGDPVADISAIRRASMVIKEGVVYFPAEVYEALGVRRFVDPPPFATGGAVAP